MLTRPLIAIVVAVLSAVTIVTVAQAGKRPPRELLPDLVQEKPRDLDLRIVESPLGQIFRLGFPSSVHNAGSGPLLFESRRKSIKTPAMSAEQLIVREDGRIRRRPRVGVVQYTRSPTHDHWHFLRFERYELRTLDDRVVAADQKSGFCIGDRYDAQKGKRWAGAPKVPPYTGECGRGQPNLKSVVEGMSVGYGDLYESHLEGQFLDLNGIPAGEYKLVHRVNTDRRILEKRYDNNSACLRVSLAWPDGPTVWPDLRELPEDPCS